MNKFFKFLYPTLILAAICLIVSLALSSTNAVTEKKIEKINAKNTEKAMSRVLEAKSYTEKTLQKDGSEITYYEAADDGEVKGYIFITGANGYGGEVRVMTAVLTDNSVKAVEILDVSNETPGLGQNAKNEKFYTQFSGLSGEITVVKSGANSENGEINAITGATITSRAVTASVNEALSLYDEIKANGGGQ